MPITEIMAISSFDSLEATSKYVTELEVGNEKSKRGSYSSGTSKLKERRDSCHKWYYLSSLAVATIFVGLYLVPTILFIVPLNSISLVSEFIELSSSGVVMFN